MIRSGENGEKGGEIPSLYRRCHDSSIEILRNSPHLPHFPHLRTGRSRVGFANHRASNHPKVTPRISAIGSGPAQGADG